MAVQILSNTKGVRNPAGNNNYPGKSITEIIINGFFTVDRTWTVKYWNKAAERILGVPAKDVIGKNLWEKFAGIIPLDFYAVHHKAFLQDIPVHFEEYWGEMGAWFDVITYHCDDTLSVSFKSSSQSGHPEYPKNQEQQLQVMTQLYRFVTEVTNDCLWEWNLHNRQIFWLDGGHKRVFGYQIENALIPQSFWESRLHPDDKAYVLTKLNKIITEGSGSLWEIEYRFQKADGDYAYVHDRGHIIYNGDNMACRMIGATQDITARRLAEIQLLENEKKLALIARQTVNALIIIDGGEKITWVNSAFTQLTEYESEEVIGKEPESFLQGKDTDPSTIQYVKQKIKDKERFDCEIINHSKSGRMYGIHVQGQPLLDEKGNFDRYLVIETDITEKILLENKLAEERLTRHREVTAAVLTAQENERADIGKELHDNLGQILGAAKLYIQMSQKYDDKRDMYLDKSCGFIVNVIEEVRKISKALVPPGLYIIGLLDSIKNLLFDLSRVYPLKIEFHEKGIYEEDLPEKLQLNIFRIVQEQVNNILKHANATHATIQLIRQENEILLNISDNGEGCDILKEKNGVGIINIRSRAELYHGKVTIVSKPGEGYQLNVSLPLEDLNKTNVLKTV